MRIPFELVQVTWVDSSMIHVSGWQHLEDVDQSECSLHVSVGYVIKSNPDSIVLAGHLGAVHNAKTGDFQHYGALLIPKVAIQDKVVLQTMNLEIFARYENS
jgi:hypothetical protein